MPILDIDPGQSPEAPGTLYFYEQGQDPATGFQVTTRGAILGAVTGVSAAYTGAAASSTIISGIVTGDAFDRVRIRADGRLDWGDGTGARDTDLYRNGPGSLTTDGYFVMGAGQSNGTFTAFGGNLVVGSAGKGLQIKEGANATMGRSTLVGGTVTVNTTAVTNNSEINAFCQTPGGTPGFLRCSARVAGTSFTILSSSGTDTSVIAWWITEPAA